MNTFYRGLSRMVLSYVITYIAIFLWAFFRVTFNIMYESFMIFYQPDRQYTDMEDVQDWRDGACRGSVIWRFLFTISDTVGYACLSGKPVRFMRAFIRPYTERLYLWYERFRSIRLIFRNRNLMINIEQTIKIFLATDWRSTVSSAAAISTIATVWNPDVSVVNLTKKIMDRYRCTYENGIRCESGLYEQYTESALAKSVYQILVVLVTTGLLKEVQYSIQDVEVFALKASEKKLTLKTIITSAEDLFKATLLAVENYKKYGTFEGMFSSSSVEIDAADLLGEYYRVQDGSATVDGTTTYVDIQTRAQRIKKKIEAYMLKNPRHPQIYNTYSEKLHTIICEIDDIMLRNKNVITGFGIKIEGGSEIGKSVLVTALMTFIADVNNIPCEKENIAYYNTSSEYDDSIFNNTKIVVVDELANGKPDSQKRTSASIVLKLINSVGQPMTKAELNLKNRVRGSAELIIATTNNPTLNAQHESVCPVSVLRRFRVHIVMRVKPEFTVEGGVSIDPVKVEARYPGQSLANIWNFDVYRFLPVADSKKWKKDYIRKDIEVKELFSLLREMSQEHYTKERTLLKRRDNVDMFKCGKNGLPVAFDDETRVEALGLSSLTGYDIDVEEDLSQYFPYMVASTVLPFQLVKMWKVFWIMAKGNITIFSGIVNSVVFILLSPIYPLAVYFCGWISLLPLFVAIYVYSTEVVTHYAIRKLFYLTAFRNVRTKFREWSKFIIENKMKLILSLLASVFGIWQLCLLFQEKTRTETGDPDDMEEHKKEFETPNNWDSDRGYIGNTAPAVMTMTADQVLQRITNNIGIIKLFTEVDDWEQDMDETLFRVVFPTTHCMIVPSHATRPGKVYKCELHQTRGRRRFFTIDRTKGDLQVQRIEGIDADLVYVTGVDSVKNIIPMFSKKRFMDSFDAKMFVFDTDTVSRISVKGLKYTYMRYEDDGDTITSLNYRGTAQAKTRVGYCGSVYVTDWKHPEIIGIHVTGSKDELNHTVSCTSMTQELLERARDALYRKNRMMYVDEDTAVECMVALTSPQIHPLCPTNMVSGPYTVVGSIPGSGPSRCPMKKTPFSTYVQRTLGVEDRWAQPPGCAKFIGGELHSPWKNGLEELQICRNRFLHSELVESRNNISSDLKEKLNIYLGNVSPLSLDDVVNGVFDNKFCKGLKMSTSAGVGRKGKKKDYLDVCEFPYSMTDEIELLFFKTDAQIRSGIRTSTYLQANLKMNEPLKKEKCENYRTRIFFNLELIQQMLAVKYFGPIQAYLTHFNYTAEFAGGLDMTGYDYQVMLDTLEMQPSSSLVAFDYFAYDKTIPENVTKTAWSILIDVADAMGYSEEDKRAMWVLAEELTHAYVNWNGTLIQIHCQHTSGNIVTALAGSLINRVLKTVAAMKIMSYVDFRRDIRSINLGDDNQNNNLNPSNGFDFFYLQQFFEKRGIKITMPDKTSTPTQFQNFSTEDFLKRLPRFCSERGAYVGVLSESSLYKSLLWYEPSKFLEDSVLFGQIFDSVLMEAALHGEAVFNKYLRLAKDLSVEHNFVFNTYEYAERVNTWKSRALKHPKYVSKDGDEVALGDETQKEIATTVDSYQSSNYMYGDEGLTVCETCNTLRRKNVLSSAIEIKHTNEQNKTTHGKLEMDFATLRLTSDIQRHEERTVDAGAHFNHQLGRFLESPVLVTSFRWEEDFESLTIDPWRLFMEATPTQQKTANYEFIYAPNIVVTIVLTSTVFKQGILRIAHIPYAVKDDFVSAETSLVLSGDNQRYHVLLDASKSQSEHMQLDYYYPRNMLRVRERNSAFGKLRFSPLVDINDAAGRINSAEVQIYVHAPQVSLYHPTGNSLDSDIRTEAKKAKSGKYKDGQYHGGKMEQEEGVYSRNLHKLGRAVSTLKELPIIGEFAKPASMVFNTAGNFAGELGYCKPNVAHELSHFKQFGSGSYAVADDNDSSRKLSLTSNCELTVDPRTVMRDPSVDEMSFDYIGAKETHLGNIRWDTTMQVGEKLFQIPVNCSVARSEGANEMLSPSGYLAIAFRYWAASVTYKLHIAATDRHAGKLALVYEPGSPPATWKEQTQRSILMDIQETRLMEKTIPWASETNFLQTRTFAAQIGDIGINGVDNGNFVVYVASPLVPPMEESADYIDIALTHCLPPGLSLFEPTEDKLGIYSIVPNSVEAVETPPTTPSAYALPTRSNSLTCSVFYYPWHDTNQWDQGYLRGALEPPQTPFSSISNIREYEDSLSTATEQVTSMVTYGVNNAFASYWGLGSKTDNNIKSYFQPAITGQPLTYALLIESTGFFDGSGVTGDLDGRKLYNSIQDARDNHFNHSNYYKIDGRPVVFIYLFRAMSDVDRERFVAIMQNAMQNVPGSVIPDTSVPLPYVIVDQAFGDPQPFSLLVSNVVDAVSVYDVYGQLAKGKTKVTDAEVKLFMDKWNEWARITGKPIFPTVSPGYNDRGVRLQVDHPPLSRALLDYEEGSLFKSCLKYLDDIDFDVLGESFIINSWNEWNEDSQIEPVVSLTPGSGPLNLPLSITGGLPYPAYVTQYLDILQAYMAGTAQVAKKKFHKVGGAQIVCDDRGEMFARLLPTTSHSELIPLKHLEQQIRVTSAKRIQNLEAEKKKAEIRRLQLERRKMKTDPLPRSLQEIVLGTDIPETKMLRGAVKYFAVHKTVELPDSTLTTQSTLMPENLAPCELFSQEDMSPVDILPIIDLDDDYLHQPLTEDFPDATHTICQTAGVTADLAREGEEHNPGPEGISEFFDAVWQDNIINDVYAGEAVTSLRPMLKRFTQVDLMTKSSNTFGVMRYENGIYPAYRPDLLDSQILNTDAYALQLHNMYNFMYMGIRGGGRYKIEISGGKQINGNFRDNHYRVFNKTNARHYEALGEKLLDVSGWSGMDRGSTSENKVAEFEIPWQFNERFVSPRSFYKDELPKGFIFEAEVNRRGEIRVMFAYADDVMLFNYVGVPLLRRKTGVRVDGRRDISL